MYTVGIITASDKGSRGERVDESAKVIREMVTQAGYEVIAYEIVPDEKDQLKAKMIEFADEKKVNLILTTGGTGFSKRDVTPEATLAIVDRQVPGIAEAMRYESLKITPKAMLSRAVSGLRGDTLIVNLPGSPKACKENLQVILGPVKHGIEILLGEAAECAEPMKK